MFLSPPHVPIVIALIKNLTGVTVAIIVKKKIPRIRKKLFKSLEE